jgi:sulfite dehydrogenase (cytochrome) subunit B
MGGVVRALIYVFAVALFAAQFSAARANAEEKPIDLKPGPGLDKVQANCGTCHSLDYIQMNSPFLEGARWDAEIAKMVRAMGAPISDVDAKAIGEYLKQNYGN